MRIRQAVHFAVILILLAGTAIAGYATRDRWLPLFTSAPTAPKGEVPSEPVAAAGKIIVPEQAQRNLGLKALPLKPQTYWRTIQVPGMVLDKPGQSDRSIVAPASGVIVQVNCYPGDTVQSDQELFLLRFQSESLHETQSELFKATQDLALAQSQQERLTAIRDVLPAERIIEVDSEIKRYTAAVSASRQKLRNHGFDEQMLEAASGGQFVTEMQIMVPTIAPVAGSRQGQLETTESIGGPAPPRTYEVQEIRVELGQMVQSGQTLCLLSNHQELVVEGRAFRDETVLLERSVQEDWPVEVDFREEAQDWGPFTQTFHIRHLANTIDPVNRTFAFRMPLENQSRTIDIAGRTQTLWRFRPGQKVRILVRVERLDNVFVLPADAVASDGPESFIFTQNVNTFVRTPVRVLLHDRRQVVIANDGVIVPGSFAVQLAAEQLNRMVKSGQNTGVPKGYHVHADGSLHKNEDEAN